MPLTRKVLHLGLMRWVGRKMKELHEGAVGNMMCPVVCQKQLRRIAHAQEGLRIVNVAVLLVESGTVRFGFA